MASPTTRSRHHRPRTSTHVRHRSRDSSNTLESARTVISPGSRPDVLSDDALADSFSAPERVGRLCTLWVHDDTFSRDEVILNTALFPPNTVEIGRLAAIVQVKSDVNVRDFQDEAQEASSDDAGKRKRRGATRKGGNGMEKKASCQALGAMENFAKWGGQDVDMSKRYVFRVKDMSNEQRSKQPTLQISLASHIAQVFGFKNRTQVMISMVDETLNTASHVELAFRDEYLARSDMWRLAMSELSNKTVYRGQKILFMGTIKAQVKQIYVRGQRVQSAYFSANTRPVFRSESARYVLFVQMSSEMWDFDSDASGEIMFNKVINGFLPDLFRRWMSMNARHLVSIVLFTRVEYEKPLSTSLDSEQQPRHGDQSRRMGGDKKLHHDFYRVVVSEMTSGDWVSILYQLKKEFKVFRRDISIQKSPLVPREGVDPLNQHPGNTPEALLMGQPSAAIHGNILEAINLASSQFSADYIDRDLVRTGISIVVITPGSGLFEVDYKMLKTTTETLVSNGIGIDVVCLTKMPLHSVPLFKYRNPTFANAKGGNLFYRPASGDTTPRQLHSAMGSYSSLRGNQSPSKHSAADGSPKASAMVSRTAEWCYAIPHWIDVSFWAGPSNVRLRQLDKEDGQGQMVRSGRARASGFVPRVKMYELQMMGIMENEMSNISIPYLHQSPFYPKSGHPPPATSKAADVGGPVNGNYTAHVTPNAPLFRPTNIVTASFYGKTDLLRPISKEDKGAYKWMEIYDENVFHPLRRVRAAEREAKLGKANADDHSRDADALLFGTSYNEHNRSPVGSHVHAGTAYFDRKMKERQEKAELQAEKTRSANKTNRTMRSVRSTRQFSSGLLFLGTAAPKALASTELRTEHARPGPVLRSLSGMHVLHRPETSSAFVPSRSTTRGSDRESIQSDTSSDSNEIVPVSTIFRGSMADSPSRPIAIRGTLAAKKENNVVKPKTNVASPFDAFAHDVRQSERIDVLQAASKTKQAGPRFDPSGSVPKLMMTLSPTSALAPWLTLLNPSNPRKHNVNIENDFGRWQHVFPRPIRTSAMKWKSLCSPASVPLTTEVFPTAEQLASEYQENPYNIAQNDDEELNEDPKTRDGLMKELIALRLSQGFQIVVGAAVTEALGHMSLNLANLFDSSHMAEDGALVVMSMGNTIHQLQCIEGGEVEVKRFVRKSTNSLSATESGTHNHREADTYQASIRTALAETYELRQVVFQPPREDQNWNYVDSFIAGYEEQFTEHLRFWRARFVLIPIEPPVGARRHLHTLNEDSEEEVRLEGIRKLTQMWQRYRVSVEEGQVQATRRQRKDTNPLDIVYQTRDPSAVIAAELDSLPLVDLDPNGPKSQLLSEAETFSKPTMKLSTLAQAIQGEKGITMQDRRWHFRLHSNCFIGFEMTTWLLENFGDVNTREDAVEFGNELMTAGLFQHVEKRHQFRDGNFFYQIASEYRAARPESRRGWFGGGGGTAIAAGGAGGSIRKSERSIPTTPLTGPIGGSPRTEASRTSSHPSDDPTSATKDTSEASTPTTVNPPTTKKLKIALSKVMRYDVDHRKRSYRPEHINLHYDRLHNPDNCYHIRIDWMNVTAKLIEDAIVLWATSAEKFGLRLVEVPIGEASSITDIHPFRAPYIINLALPPPSTRPSISQHHSKDHLDASTLSPRFPTIPTPTQRHPYHHLLLRRFNFVLDIEAASNFPPDVDVSYSWGRPSYRYTQYIHRSGSLLAQITDAGALLLLANRLCNDRTAAGAEKPPTDHPHRDRDRRSVAAASSGGGGGGGSPFSSPLVRAALGPPNNLGMQGVDSFGMAPHQVKDELEAFCASPALLGRFYEEVAGGPGSAASASPLRHGAVEEGSIPTLGLPPSLRGIGGAGGGEGSGSPRSSPRGSLGGAGTGTSG